MTTWLFTWNPAYYPWNDSLESYKNVKAEIDQIGFSFQRWTCGITKRIKLGDRIFLIRLGKDKAGIVASGTAASDVFAGPHWNPDLAKDGKTVNRAFVKFDHVIDPDIGPILEREFLQKHFPTMCWSPQASGISIPDHIALQLETEWQRVTTTDR